MSSPETDTEAVEAANTALYEAVEQGDIEALSRLWLEDEEVGGSGVSVVHPGWPVLTGRGEVPRARAGRLSALTGS